MRSSLSIIKLLSYGFAVFWVVRWEIAQPTIYPAGWVMVLGWIALSQLRENYFFSYRMVFFWASLAAETVLGVLLFFQYGGFLSIFLLSVIMDGSISKKNAPYFISLAAILSVLVLAYHTVSPNFFGGQDSVAFWADLLLCLFPAGFCLILQKERGKKQIAQELYDQLRVSEERLKEAYDTLEQYSQTIEELTLLRERARISRELHDSAGHALSTLGIQLQAIRSLIQKDPGQAEQMIGHLVGFTQESLENVRRTVRELRPIEFDHFEGIFAIEELIKTFRKLTGMDVRLIRSKAGYSINSDQSHQLYRIVQECLSNSLRHGKAQRVQISIQFLEDGVYSQIKDDGQGSFPIQFGMGLKGIRERVDSLGGTMAVFSEPGKGFEVNVHLPRRIAEGAKKEDTANDQSIDRG